MMVQDLRINDFWLSTPEAEEASNATNTIGIMQALISVFLDDNDKLRCINAGRTRISFLLRSPLYYACASSWGEPESVVSLSIPRIFDTFPRDARFLNDLYQGRRVPIWSFSIFKS